MPAEKSVEEFIQELPTAAEIRARIGENLNEAKLLKKMLRMAEDREQAQRCREMATGGAS